MKETKFAITGVNPDDLIKGKDLTGMLEDTFRVVGTVSAKQYPNPPHKHRDLIIAWANGADIEVSTIGFNWMKCNPSWHHTLMFRIKPTKTPLELKIAKLEAKLAKLKGELCRIKK